MSQHEPLSSDRGPQWWSALIKRLRLAWRLLRDPQVPGWTKLIPLGATLYLFLPADLIPDVFFALGQLDDLGVLYIALRTFINLCPPQVVQKHLAAMSSVDGSYRIVEEEPTKPPTAGYLDDAFRSPANEATPPTVEGTARQTDQKP